MPIWAKAERYFLFINPSLKAGVINLKLYYWALAQTKKKILIF
jgi:hypothetical protein